MSDLPIITVNEDPAKNVQLAQTDITQATGFKAKKSVTQDANGGTLTEYRIDVGGTHTVATIGSDGTASLSTTRGRVAESAMPGDAEKNFEAAMGKALHATPSGATPQQEAKDFAAVMEAAFASKTISPTEIANLTALNDTAQALPARGPRTGGVVR